MYNGGAGSGALQSPAPVDAFDADEHDEFEWFNAESFLVIAIYK